MYSGLIIWCCGRFHHFVCRVINPVITLDLTTLVAGGRSLALQTQNRKQVGKIMSLNIWIKYPYGWNMTRLWDLPRPGSEDSIMIHWNCFNEPIWASYASLSVRPSCSMSTLPRVLCIPVGCVVGSWHFVQKRGAKVTFGAHATIPSPKRIQESCKSRCYTLAGRVILILSCIFNSSICLFSQNVLMGWFRPIAGHSMDRWYKRSILRLRMQRWLF